MNRASVLLLIIFVSLGFVAWATDTITLKGEWTVYTVACEGGSWQGNRCGGKFVPSKLYRFRSLKAHREVLFWTAGGQEPSGKYSECKISDGRNWFCSANADAERTITHHMVHGRPLPDPEVPTISFHEVPKWRWGLMQLGIPAGSDATE